MRLAHRVTLAGKQLDEVDPRIIIKSVEGGAGKETVTAVSTGAGDGTRITGKRRESIDVTVKFSMNIRRDRMDERMEVLEKVIAWAAGGGTFKCGYKPNRLLRVDEVVLPGEGDLWQRLSEYTIVFRARTVPYWQENTPAEAATKTVKAGSGTLTVAGSAKTVADATLENRSGATINKAEITIGGKKMVFESLGMTGGQKLVIDHVATQGKNVIRMRLIKADGTSAGSVLAKRTAESADEFLISPGACEFSFTADRACVLTVSCRGRFA